MLKSGSSTLQTNLAVDAAQLRLDHRMESDVDWELVRRAAANCLEYGYTGQARQILDLSGVDRAVKAGILSRLVEQLGQSGGPVRATAAAVAPSTN